MQVLVVAPNPEWPAQFLAEARRMRGVLPAGVRDVHHIGSTAIAGIFAKPVIDILLIAVNLQCLDDAAPAMAGLGYVAIGEFGIPGRRYFRRDSAAGLRTHQVHGFQVGSPDIDRHLAFRDYMRAHPAAAAPYSELKRQLAARYPHDLQAYMDGKDAFIKAHEVKALLWACHPNERTNPLDG